MNKVIWCLSTLRHILIDFDHKFPVTIVFLCLIINSSYKFSFPSFLLKNSKNSDKTKKVIKVPQKKLRCLSENQEERCNTFTDVSDTSEMEDKKRNRES